MKTTSTKQATETSRGNRFSPSSIEELCARIERHPELSESFRGMSKRGELLFAMDAYALHVLFFKEQIISGQRKVTAETADAIDSAVSADVSVAVCVFFDRGRGYESFADLQSGVAA